MPDNLLLFIGMTTLVSLAPGPNVMFIMSQAALRGHRAGLMAGFGIQVANVFYFALTALGLAGLIATSPLAFFILKWLGAGYLALIGVLALIRSFKAHKPVDADQPAPIIAVHRGAFFDGLMLGLGNPKTIIWFITLLPQFIDAKQNVLSQTLVIGVIGTIIDMAIQWMYTHIGGAMSRFLAKPHIRKWFERGVGIVFIALALLVAFGLRQHI
ncbi:MAG TPA: LysE family translocator [Hyphomonadaceae bacterium]|jgi:threonine/homoserine/homoserine lactone efflux protein|nr:LysE family translocator [Hyphomonadaceae bacterium]HPN07342.1 LysE family translocator [Hyphomonadaceae bacterium]